MIGFSEGVTGMGAVVTVALAAALLGVVWRLYATGYGLKE